MTALCESLTPLRNLLTRGSIGMICRVWDRDRFAGLPRLDWPADVERAFTAEEKIVFDLLFAGRRVQVSEAAAVISESGLTALQSHGILRMDDGFAVTEGFLLNPESGYFIFTGYKRSREAGEVYVHLGYDSLTFSDLLMYCPRSSKALEVCAGSGILSLALARVSERVTGVEWSPGVRKVAQVNVALAGLDERVDIREGDLFEPVRGERFDVIVANPPFSPTLMNPARDPVAAGGLDGLSVARSILDKAPGHLTERGRILTLLGMLGDERHAYFETELAAYAGARSCRIQIVDLQPVKPVSKLTIPRYNDEPVALRLRQIRDGALALGASYYHVALVVASFGEPAGVTRLGMRRDRESDWVRAVRDMREHRRDAAQ